MTNTHAALRACGVSKRASAALTGLARATATRRAKAAAAPTPAVVAGPRAEPANKLTDTERRTVEELLTGDQFVDLAPLQVYAQLLDEGRYVCSVSTMYRILAENKQVKERRRLARHPAKACPELVATAPRQVYSWDITKLAGPVKGTYYDAYVMMDIYSRYIVGVHVHAHESGVLAREMMEQIFAVHGVPHVVHADRGTSMTSKPVAQLLLDLGARCRKALGSGILIHNASSLVERFAAQRHSATTAKAQQRFINHLSGVHLASTSSRTFSMP